MPWQMLVAEVGGEIDPATGLPAYREVIVTVPRQSGKTTLVLAWEVQRGNGWAHLGPQRIVYSAQTGNDARKKLVEDQVPIIEPRKAKLGVSKILNGMGNEAVIFKNGSRLVLMASGEKSGHGKTVDLGIKDEFFADVDNRRDQALIPAMATKAHAQVLTTSTAGTDESVPLNEAVKRGRAAVDAGVRHGIAYFEWSADPSDDPDDPEVWARCMPALGHTISLAVVEHARSTLPDGEFRRAFLNIPTVAEDRVIPAAEWSAVCSPSVSPDGHVVFSVDVNEDRSAGAIVAASERVCELIEFEPHTGWIVDRATAINDKWGGHPWWVVDAAGPAASFVPALKAAGLRVHEASSREVIDACSGFYDGVIEGSLRVRSDSRMDTAAAGAAKRTVGDSFAWTRRHAMADVSPLMGATLGVWGARHLTPTGVSSVLMLDDFLDEE